MVPIVVSTAVTAGGIVVVGRGIVTEFVLGHLHLILGVKLLNWWEVQM